MSNNFNHRRLKTVDSVAGAGSGTLLLTLAQNLPDNAGIKKWMILIAPSLSVFISAFFSWTRNEMDRYVQNKRIEAVYSTTKNKLIQMIDNSHTSNEHKLKLQRELEKLEMAWVNADLKRISTIDIKY